MEGRKLLQYIIDTSDVVLAKKQEATEYLAKLEEAAKQGLRPTKGIRPAKKALSKPRHFELGYPRSVETAQQGVQQTCANCGADDWHDAIIPDGIEICGRCGASR